MFALGWFLCILLVSRSLRSALTPTHCYNFVTNSALSNDECGSGPALTPTAGDGNSPYCDSSGCAFDLNSDFHTTIPSGIPLDWTFSFWVVFDGNTQSLVNIIKGISATPYIKIEKVFNVLQLTLDSTPYQVTFTSQEWGDKEWSFVFCASTTTDTVFGARVNSLMHYTNTYTSTNLLEPTIVIIGSNYLGGNPTHLVRRFNIYSSFITPDTVPETARIYQGLHCLDFEAVLFCPDTYIHYKMEPSFINGQTVIDSSSNASHATNGIDGTPSKDATVYVNFNSRTQFGLLFDGRSQVTINPFPSPLSSFSFSLSVWLRLDPLNYSFKQTIFLDSTNKFKVDLIPASSFFSVNFDGSVLSASSFPLACHPSCISCADSSGSLCGMCADGFQLANPGTPGLCLPSTSQCDDTCDTCSGPQSTECMSCTDPYLPGFASGSGSCILDCSQLDQQYELQNGSCSESPIRVSLSQTVYNSHSNELILHFSQPLLFTNLKPADFTISPNTISIDLEHSHIPVIGYSLAISFKVRGTLDSTQIFNITLSSSNLGVISSNHILFPLYSLNPIQLPPQFHQTPLLTQAVDVTGFVTENTSLVLLIALLITQCYFQISFQMLWALFHFNQLVFFAPLINLSFPPLLFLLMRPLRFSVGDLLLLVLLYDFLFQDYLSSLPSEPYIHNFYLHDFPSISLLSNAGPFFLLLFIQLLFLLCYLLLSFKFITKCYCLFKLRSLCQTIKWNSFIRTLLEGILQLVLFSLLNIYGYLGMHSSVPSFRTPELLSLVLSCATLLLLFLFPFAIFRILAHQPTQLSSRSSYIFKTYSELFKNQNLSNGFLAQHYQIFFVLRRLVVIASLVFFPSSGMFQLLIAVVLCMIDLVVLTRVKPFKSKSDQSVSIICQWCLLGVYTTLGAIQFVEWSNKIILVWCCVGLILVGNTVGFFILINQKRLDCKKKRREKKLRRVKISRKQDTSFVSMVQTFERRVPQLSHTNYSQRPTELSLFYRRKNYNEKDSNVNEVELNWSKEVRRQ